MKKSFFAITLALSGLVAVGAAIFSQNGNAFSLKASGTNVKYGLRLDSNNAYQNDGTNQQITTYAGGQVTFTYNDCVALDGYHAAMYSGGYIRNTTKISSITSIQAEFEGSLEFRYSFDGSSWSDYSIARSGREFFFEYEPSYIELYANQHPVVLSSLVVSYACEPSTDSLEFVSKSGEITKSEFPSSSSYILSGIDGFDFTCKYAYANTTGIYFGTTSAAVELYTPLKLKSVEITLVSGKTFSGTLYSGTSFQAKTHSQSVSSAKTYTITEGDTYFVLQCTKRSSYLASIVVNYEVDAVDPLAIDVLPNNYEIKAGDSRQMFIDYYPATTNRNMDVTWESSNPTIAPITEDGVVTVSELALAGFSFTITARSTWNSKLVSSATLTVVSEKVDEWTIMVYMCGADLESGSYQASLDIIEMCEVNGIPSDVNILILTGGASAWGISGIPADENYVLTLGNNDDNETGLYLAYSGFESYMSMGDPNTLLTFMNMCINSCPAKRYGLIFWNHGGAMQGCCFDENSSNDGLTNGETAAVFDYLMENEIIAEKMDFVGYDCCLMGVQDIVVTNSSYFKYMIGSEESESGTGWDYNTWIDDVYKNKPTDEVCRAICDGLIKDNNGDAYGENENNNQTMAYYDLSYAGAYYTAFEEFASAWIAKLGSTSKSTVTTFFKTVQTYSVDSSGTETYFGVFDIIDFLTKLLAKTSLCPDTQYINNVINAFEPLVAYSVCGDGAGNSNGMTLFYAVSSNAQQTSYYTSSNTPFTNWIEFNRTYGN